MKSVKQILVFLLVCIALVLVAPIAMCTKKSRHEWLACVQQLQRSLVLLAQAARNQYRTLTNNW